MELKKMSDQELAARAIGYIERIEQLQDEVGAILDGKKKSYEPDLIRVKYKRLKEEIKADAHYLDLVRNQRFGNDLYNAIFSPSIMEASAWGFESPTNSRIDHAFFSSLYEAHYKMTKYYSFKEWKTVASGTSVVR